MLVKRQSQYSGKVHEIDLPITEEQVLKYINGNMTVQSAFPNLDASQREFIMTGITQDEWDELFPPETRA